MVIRHVVGGSERRRAALRKVAVQPGRTSVMRVAAGWPTSLAVAAAAREQDAEDGLAGPRVDGDLAVVAVDDDAACDVEAKPGAFADILGGVERLERPGRY